MAISPAFKIFVQDELIELGEINVRSMFGGAGIFLDGVMFGLIADEVVYFKVDDNNRADYEAEGMGPFTYEAKGKPMKMSYFRVPDHVFEDRDSLTVWAKKAFAVARRAKKGPP